MTKLRYMLLAGALALASMAGLAVAGGLYTNGVPQAGSLPNTLPLTGNELIPADTQLQSGLNPQTEAISVGQLLGAALANSSYSANAATAATTATAAQIVGTPPGGFVVLDMTGTLGASGALTTPTAAALIAAAPNLGNTASYTLRIISETASNTWTLTGGSNVTVTGTATITAGAFTDWIVTFNKTAATPTVTFQRAGSGTK